jgi:K+-sensing histidine kinase KdpD
VPTPAVPFRRLQGHTRVVMWNLVRRDASGISDRRLVGAFALELVALPLLTVCLAAARRHLVFADELLLYLAAVVVITRVGGLLPAVVAAVASSLLLNWFFTPPLHTWTIDSPQNLLALLLFVAVAVTVSSVVQLAARRALVATELATEAARAQALADGNRIGTALLAAAGHDLRTPLASVKASVSTLRQTDVTWSPQDQADLLATIEEGTDRLTALISNLLDMSRIQAGVVQLFVRPVSLEEVAPLVVQAVDGGALLRLEVSEDPRIFARIPGCSNVRSPISSPTRCAIRPPTSHQRLPREPCPVKLCRLRSSITGPVYRRRCGTGSFSRSNR